jgi:hypothetical protein
MTTLSLNIIDYSSENYGDTYSVQDIIEINNFIYLVGIIDAEKLYLERRNLDNTIDNTFGDNGIILLDEVNNNYVLNSKDIRNQIKKFSTLIRHDNNKIYIFMTRAETLLGLTSPVIIRLNLDGTIDYTYNNGLGYFSFGVMHESGFVDVIKMDGSFYTIYQSLTITQHEFYLYKLNNDGMPDIFMQKEISVLSNDTQTNMYSFNITSMSNDSNNNIYLALDINETSSSFTRGNIIKVLPDLSTLDLTFGTNGIYQTSYVSLNNIFICDVVVDAYDKIYALYTEPTQYNIIINKLNDNGTLDTGFNNSGSKIIANVDNLIPYTQTSIIDSNNNYMFVGTYHKSEAFGLGQINYEEKFFIFKIKSDGSTESDDIFNEDGLYEPQLSLTGFPSPSKLNNLIQISNNNLYFAGEIQTGIESSTVFLGYTSFPEEEAIELIRSFGKDLTSSNEAEYSMNRMIYYKTINTMTSENKPKKYYGNSATSDSSARLYKRKLLSTASVKNNNGQNFSFRETTPKSNLHYLRKLRSSGYVVPNK